MNRFFYLTAAVLLFSVGKTTIAANRILFLGMSAGGAPAIESTFEKLLRERLSMVPELNLIDYVETLRYQHIIDFKRYPTVSEKMVKNLQKIVPDSFIVIWGGIKHLGIKPIRQNIIGSAAEGELTVGLTVYHISRGAFLHSGDIKSSFRKNKGFVFFSPAEKVVSVTAADRVEITNKLIDDALSTATSIIVSILKSADMLQPIVQSGGDNDVNKTPSISDVFSVPSVDAPKIYEEKSVDVSTDKITEETIIPSSNENNSSTETK
jgi:hypothetical protein